jgi:hemoglobin-like flavoprotein
MTASHVALVRSAWSRVLPMQERAAALFYRRLFGLDPRLRRLFRGDMKEQGRKLTAMIGLVVSQLDRMAALLPAVEDLGRRHAGYGVASEDYDTVGTALLSTLRTALGSAWTREMEAAWALAYATLAGAMRRPSSDARA